MPATELGWFIDRAYWRQGLATEGAARAITLAFEQLRLGRVIARYNAENVASGRVMEKIGMHFWQELPDRQVPGVVVRMYEKFPD